MEQQEIKRKMEECLDALNENNRTTSFTVDEDFYSGITVTFNLESGEEYYASVEVKDNGVINGQIAYGGDWLAYGVPNEYGGEYEECIYNEEFSKKSVIGTISSGIYESIKSRHEGFFIGDKIKFFNKELTVIKIDNDKVYISDSETVYETEVYSVSIMTGLMLSQPDTDENPIIITKGVLIK